MIWSLGKKNHWRNRHHFSESLKHNGFFFFNWKKNKINKIMIINFDVVRKLVCSTNAENHAILSKSPRYAQPSSTGQWVGNIKFWSLHRSHVTVVVSGWCLSELKWSLLYNRINIPNFIGFQHFFSSNLMTDVNIFVKSYHIYSWDFDGSSDYCFSAKSI